MAWFPDGLAQNEIHHPPTFAADTNLTVTSAPAQTNRATPTVTARAGISPLTVGVAAENAAPCYNWLPAKIRLSPWAAEIVKLAESGIEDDVTLSFIDNSGTFNLGAAQIIYLSDLGVSGQVINAMLQHDREVISGVRPLTVASAPDSEPAFSPALTASRETSSNVSKQLTTAPTPSAEAATGPTATPRGESLADVNSVVSDAQPVAAPCAMVNEREPAMQSLPIQPRQSSGAKECLYPVREPYPVELLPPIVFLNAVERTPNTFIIVGFPRTAQ